MPSPNSADASTVPSKSGIVDSINTDPDTVSSMSPVASECSYTPDKRPSTPVFGKSPESPLDSGAEDNHDREYDDRRNVFNEHSGYHDGQNLPMFGSTKVQSRPSGTKLSKKISRSILKDCYIKIAATLAPTRPAPPEIPEITWPRMCRRGEDGARSRSTIGSSLDAIGISIESSTASPNTGRSLEGATSPLNGNRNANIILDGAPI